MKRVGGGTRLLLKCWLGIWLDQRLYQGASLSSAADHEEPYRFTMAMATGMARIKEAEQWLRINSTPE